jgi:MFS family permease
MFPLLYPTPRFPLPSKLIPSRLDKGNLGNAKTNGFEKDLGFTGNQYNILLSIFYIPYVLCAPPVGMLGKKYGPAKVLPVLMFTFGSMTLLGAACRNFGGMMTVRVILGAAESGFFPLVSKNWILNEMLGMGVGRVERIVKANIEERRA